MIGAMYYSPMMMGTLFLRLAYSPGYKPKDPPRLGYLASFLGAVITLTLFNSLLVILGADTWTKGVAWGFAFALFDAGLNMCHCFFENRPFGVYLIHTLYHAVCLVTIGALFATISF
eukprot:Plantae.Rhodophyta-Hildenbrandia_rubra.ctg6330.p1 GENE.Plantae.Rhodophyta-Hildenbrandia_rubra.ctg6330~~Plantae.Rhodophyta-Hildenbrandia_rubra.ctg6330.p1  ORF type:complete len:117 (-),score=0.53 Plantae.Rhodophyta-Hildenbrandia_rubra.ctg6330:643-993(-)